MPKIAAVFSAELTGAFVADLVGSVGNGFALFDEALGFGEPELFHIVVTFSTVVK